MILKPRYPKKYHHPMQSPKDLNGVINMFEHLAVEDTSARFDNASNVLIAPMDSASASANYKAKREEEDQKESFVAFYFFLHDLHKMRNEVQRAWTGYKNGLLDLMAASITANTAVDLARAMEEELNHLFAKSGGAMRMLEVYYIAHCMMPKLPSGAAVPQVFQEQPGNELNFKKYEIADAIFWPAALLLRAICDVLKICPTPEARKGVDGIYDPSTLRSKKSNREKFREDKVLLFEMLPEFFFYCRALPERPPEEDEFTRGLRETF
jgi:hypothetical protein